MTAAVSAKSPSAGARSLTLPGGSAARSCGAAGTCKLKNDARRWRPAAPAAGAGIDRLWSFSCFGLPAQTRPIRGRGAPRAAPAKRSRPPAGL